MQASTTTSVRPPSSGDEAGRDLGQDVGVGAGRAGQLRLGQRREAPRADERARHSPGVGRDEVAGVVARDGAGGREHADALRTRQLGRRLDRRHGADERDREALPQRRQHQGRGGVAGDHDEVGRMPLDQALHDR